MASSGGRGTVVPGKPKISWLFQLEGPPPGLQAKYVRWLARQCSWSDGASLALYAVVCLVMSISMWRMHGLEAVPGPPWLAFGLITRETACLLVLWLKYNRPQFYQSYRTVLLVAVQLICHVSGLLLEAPATFWIHPVKGSNGFLTPLVGQIFEVLGFRISFFAHIVRALLDLGLSFMALLINMSFGWAGSLWSPGPGISPVWWTFLFQYAVCSGGLMSIFMCYLERRTISDFLRSTDALKVLQDFNEAIPEPPANRARQLPHYLHLWYNAHTAWIPQCSARTISVKFHNAYHQDLTQGICSEIRLAVADALPARFFACRMSFFEGCVHVLSTNYADFRMSTPAEDTGPCESSSSMPSSAESDGSICSVPRGPASPERQESLQSVTSVMQSAPTSWKTGHVSGYCETLGGFELVEDSIVCHSLPPASQPQILAVSPVCCALKPASQVRVHLVCRMCPGDPIICTQEGLRVPADILSCQQLEFLENTDDMATTYEVKMQICPRQIGAVEFHAISKAMLVPFNSNLRTVDEGKAADQAYQMLSSGLAGTGLKVAEVASNAVPVLVLSDAAAAAEIQNLLAPQQTHTNSARSSLEHVDHDSSRSDSGDDSRDDSTSATCSSKMPHTEGFCYSPPTPNWDVDRMRYQDHITRFQQLAPTLTLSGIVRTCCHLREQKSQEALARGEHLLMSNNIRSGTDWQQLVESVALFYCRHGMCHATMEFLHAASADGKCASIPNLLHYAVASGSAKLVSALVSKFGSELSGPSDYGTTPLHLAAAMDCTDLLHALLEDPGNCLIAAKAKDTSGKSAMEYAADLGLHANVQAILQRCEELGVKL